MNYLFKEFAGCEVCSQNEVRRNAKIFSELWIKNCLSWYYGQASVDGNVKLDDCRLTEENSIFIFIIATLAGYFIDLYNSLSPYFYISITLHLYTSISIPLCLYISILLYICASINLVFQSISVQSCKGPAMGFFVGCIAFKSYVENLGVYFYYVKIPIQQMLHVL